MNIERATIRNFGKLQNREIDFSEGINVIYGENESGKTTLHAFLTGMLFGLEKSRGRQIKEDFYNFYEPWNSASFYAGEIIFRAGGKRFLLERNFYHKEKTATLKSLDDGEILSVEHGDLEMLLCGTMKEAYENTYCIRQAGFLADDSLAVELENYISDVANTGDGSIRIQAALQMLGQKQKAAQKEKKRLESEREEKLEMLIVEADLLKKDIAFQKNSELAEQLKRQAETTSKKPEVSSNRHRLIQNILAVVIAITGFAMLLAGEYSFYAGLFLAVGGTLFLFIKGITSRPEPSDSQTLSESELEESIAQITEQWKEKENRYYNIEELIQELKEPTEQELELSEDLEALQQAMETIRKISRQIYEEISDDLHEAVSRNLSRITKGKYDSIQLDENLHLSIIEEHRSIPVSQLSRGTLEQAYLAIRVAVGDILMRQESMPVMLDETFSMYDDTRLGETLKWMTSYPGQILLFSCQKRELELFDSMGIEFRKILL